MFSLKTILSNQALHFGHLSLQKSSPLRLDQQLNTFLRIVTVKRNISFSFQHVNTQKFARSYRHALIFNQLAISKLET